MVNTLRRKMFKLGGSANTHGVGITSGLKMKKGGKVEPQATFGVGNNALRKIGPDGKEREAHVAFLPSLGSLAFAGGRTALGALNALRKGQSFRNIFGLQRTGPIGAPVTTTGPGGIMTIRSGARELAPGRFMTAGISPDRLRQASKILAGTTGAAGAVGGISSLLPEFQDSPDDSLLENIIDPIRGASEFGFDVATGVPTIAAQAPFRKLEDIEGGSSIIRNLIYGKPEAPVAGGGDESERTKDIQTQASQFEGLSEKAEALAKEITRENNLAVLSKAASDFGVAALSGADLAESLAAGSAGIYDELGRRRDIQENIGGMLAQQIFADEATQSAMIAEAAKTGDPAAVNRMQKYFDAYNEGVTMILPVDAKGKMNTTEMAPGKVYMDLEGLSGSRYVAVDTKKPDGSGGVPKAFDSIEDANAYAQS